MNKMILDYALDFLKLNASPDEIKEVLNMEFEVEEMEEDRVDLVEEFHKLIRNERFKLKFAKISD